MLGLRTGPVKKLITPKKRFYLERRCEFFSGLVKKTGWIKSWRPLRNEAGLAMEAASPMQRCTARAIQ